MSVRQRTRRNPRTGTVQKTWIVDVDYQRPDQTRAPRIRKVSPVQTRRGAEEYERQLRQSLLSGTYGKEDRQPVPTVTDFAAEFLSTYAETNNKASEVETKRMIIGLHLVPALGGLRLDRVGPGEIEEYKARKLKAGLKPKTVNNHLIVLRRMLSVAEEWGRIDHVPRVKWLKTPRADFDFLTFSDAERLLTAGEGEWRAMVAVALKAGLRQGELLALRWRDVDLAAGKILVRQSAVRGIISTPKSGRPREVQLSSDLSRILRAHRHLKGELVFCNPEGGLLTKNECRRPLYNMCRRAGVRNIGWHVLRHTFASHLAMRGAPLRAIQDLLGHASIEMTMRYAHLSPDTRRAAVELLDQPSGTLTAPETEMERN